MECKLPCYHQYSQWCLLDLASSPRSAKVTGYKDGMRLLIECDKTSTISIRRLSRNVTSVYHINTHSIACKSMKRQNLIANRRYVVYTRFNSIIACNKYALIIVRIFWKVHLYTDVTCSFPLLSEVKNSRICLLRYLCITSKYSLAGNHILFSPRNKTTF